MGSMALNWRITAVSWPSGRYLTHLIPTSTWSFDSPKWLGHRQRSLHRWEESCKRKAAEESAGMFLYCHICVNIFLRCWVSTTSLTLQPDELCTTLICIWVLGCRSQESRQKLGAQWNCFAYKEVRWSNSGLGWDSCSIYWKELHDFWLLCCCYNFCTRIYRRAYVGVFLYISV